MEKMAGPAAPGMPEPPGGTFFNDAQWAVVTAIVDTVVPAVAVQSAATDDKDWRSLAEPEYKAASESCQRKLAEPPDEAIFRAYMAERPSDDPAFMHACIRTFSRVPNAARRQLGSMLSLLATNPGSLLLTGYYTPFTQQPVCVREAILQSWSASRFSALRAFSKAFFLLAQASWLQTSPLYGRVSGFPDVPVSWRPVPQQPQGFEYAFLQFPPSPAPAVVDVDVVIVGSGCGGAVCAKVLAEAGHRVLVVDKGYYFPPTQLPMTQLQGPCHLFENGGLVNSDDMSTAVVAGACWGGGGTVNWSVSLQTQGYVRREWAETRGLPFFATQEYQACLDRVCDFMGVTEPPTCKHGAEVILEGSRRLGWDVRKAPQNCDGREHACGHCHLGCGSSEKRGPTVTWLPAAAKAGAHFVEGFSADRATFDQEAEGGPRATGLVGRWTSRDRKGGVVGPLAERATREVVVKARKVIVSAGSLSSPLILLRSGLKNRHIGRNLHVHPVNFLAAVYDEDIRPWEGGMIQSVCTNFENLDGQGHGVKLEGTCMVPFAFLAMKPWTSGLDFKLSAMRLRHMDGFISLTRDRDTGRVYPEPATGKPQIEYTPSPFDAAHTLQGIIALAKICYATGATEIHPFLPGVKPFVRTAVGATHAGEPAPSSAASVDLGVTEPTFAAWLDSVRLAGNKPPGTPFSSAHQMGTCRMSSHAGDGVVDPRGKVWGAKNLYVADASVFPSASGVNPMITNMAIADWIARGLARALAEEK